jgi:hypothetical protein
MGTTIVLNPIGRTAVVGGFDGRTVGDLAGVRIAVLDNTKPNAVQVMEEIARLLVAEHGARSYAVLRKLSASQGAGDEQLRAIAQSHDLVITGSGDCGSCTSWSALDAAELQRRGVTSVLLVTDAFVPLATALLTQEGMPDLPLAVVAHPIGGQPTERMAEIGRGVVQSLVDRLTSGSGVDVRAGSVPTDRGN